REDILHSAQYVVALFENPSRACTCSDSYHSFWLRHLTVYIFKDPLIPLVHRSGYHKYVCMLGISYIHYAEAFRIIYGSKASQSFYITSVAAGAVIVQHPRRLSSGSFYYAHKPHPSFILNKAILYSSLLRL